MDHIHLHWENLVMEPTTIASLISIGEWAINQIWPDPVRQAEEQRKLAELAQTGDLERLNAHVKLMIGQIEINKAEAQHKSVFVAGWRPFIGWVGGAAMAYQFVIYPLILWVWVIIGPMTEAGEPISPPPVMETAALWTVITGMLGIGVQRSFDKSRGVQTDSIRGK